MTQYLPVPNQIRYVNDPFAAVIHQSSSMLDVLLNADPQFNRTQRNPTRLIFGWECDDVLGRVIMTLSILRKVRRRWELFRSDSYGYIFDEMIPQFHRQFASQSCVYLTDCSVTGLLRLNVIDAQRLIEWYDLAVTNAASVDGDPPIMFRTDPPSLSSDWEAYCTECTTPGPDTSVSIVPCIGATTTVKHVVPVGYALPPIEFPRSFYLHSDFNGGGSGIWPGLASTAIVFGIDYNVPSPPYDFSFIVAVVEIDNSDVVIIDGGPDAFTDGVLGTMYYYKRVSLDPTEDELVSAVSPGGEPPSEGEYDYVVPTATVTRSAQNAYLNPNWQYSDIVVRDCQLWPAIAEKTNVVDSIPVPVDMKIEDRVTNLLFDASNIVTAALTPTQPIITGEAFVWSMPNYRPLLSIATVAAITDTEDRIREIRRLLGVAQSIARQWILDNVGSPTYISPPAVNTPIIDVTQGNPVLDVLFFTLWLANQLLSYGSEPI